MLPAEPPLDVGREEGARAAREELSKRIYHEDEPGLVERGIEWVIEKVVDVLDAASGAVPGGHFGLVVLVLLLILAALVIRWRVGALVRARRTSTGEVFGETVRTAAEHRAAASAAAERGDLATAVQELFRAGIRQLEERAILDARPGRTADETATEVAALVPELGEPLRAAARVFDEVRYGGRPATVEAYEVVRAADAAISAIRRPMVGAR